MAGKKNVIISWILINRYASMRYRRNSWYVKAMVITVILFHILSGINAISLRPIYSSLLPSLFIIILLYISLWQYSWAVSYFLLLYTHNWSPPPFFLCMYPFYQFSLLTLLLVSNNPLYSYMTFYLELNIIPFKLHYYLYKLRFHNFWALVL